jgi:hypothetical protein
MGRQPRPDGAIDMTQTLPEVAHRHHERIIQHVDLIPARADALLTDKAEDVRATVADMRTFITGTLVPHVDAAERTLYPELERMFQNRHSMAPMRREHEEVRRLATQYAKLADRVAAGQISLARRCRAARPVPAVRLVKVHLPRRRPTADRRPRRVERRRRRPRRRLEHPVAG